MKRFCLKYLWYHFGVSRWHLEKYNPMSTTSQLRILKWRISPASGQWVITANTYVTLAKTQIHFQMLDTCKQMKSIQSCGEWAWLLLCFASEDLVSQGHTLTLNSDFPRPVPTLVTTSQRPVCIWTQMIATQTMILPNTTAVLKAVTHQSELVGGGVAGSGELLVPSS